MGAETEESDAGPILLVEDTPSLSAFYAAVLRKHGKRVDCAMTASEAVRRHAVDRHGVVLLDLMLPDGDGLDVLRDMRARDPGVTAIVITANGSINKAVAAMRGGAHDFLVKPFDEARLLRSVDAALAVAHAPQDSKPAAPAGGYSGFVGSSATMREIQETVREVARSTATVFITGESGTGKEVCAQAIHAQSPRRDAAFVPLNCGAIPRDLLESEVFGHLRGSFTGAIVDKPGAAQVADGGTLFLDEICEMEPNLQTKLLRFLQSGTIQPVGSATARKVDVRIVCATNRDPAAEVRAGRFREDLFYRLHVVPIHMPPLRERGNDVVEIAEELIRRFAQEERKPFQGLSQRSRDLFLRYHWPGNVRQLQNVLRNAIVLNEGRSIEPEMLPTDLGLGALSGGSVPDFRGADGFAGMPDRYAEPAQAGNGTVRPNNGHGAGQEAPEDSPFDAMRGLVGTTLADLEREFIELTIQECGGSIPRAARILDVSPSTLYRKREAWSRQSA